MQEIIAGHYKSIDIFKNIRFVPDEHIYYLDDVIADSVTSILKKYTKPFDQAYWAKIKAPQLGVSPEELIANWELKAKLSRVKGTIVHSFIENKISNSNFVYPQEQIIEMFGYDPIQDQLHQLIPQVEKFLLDIDQKMFPIASEFIVGDKDFMVCGTVDQIFYNQKSGQLEIWDWKTNREIKTESKYFHLYELAHIPDTELDHYSLQLSLYKLILEKNTKVKFGKSYITWFNNFTQDYKIFMCKDYLYEAQLILDKLHKG